MLMEPRRTRFSRWVFLIAGLYGLAVMLPQYFLEQRIGRDDPPAITHPEYFYGFVGLAVAWQVAFLAIARDPLRHRLLMLPSVLEKFSFAVATLALFVAGRIAGPVLAFGLIDLLLGLLFLAAYWLTGSAASSAE